MVVDFLSLLLGIAAVCILIMALIIKDWEYRNRLLEERTIKYTNAYIKEVTGRCRYQLLFYRAIRVLQDISSQNTNDKAYAIWARKRAIDAVNLFKKDVE